MRVFDTGESVLSWSSSWATFTPVVPTSVLSSQVSIVMCPCVMLQQSVAPYLCWYQQVILAVYFLVNDSSRCRLLGDWLGVTEYWVSIARHITHHNQSHSTFASCSIWHVQQCLLVVSSLIKDTQNGKHSYLWAQWGCHCFRLKHDSVVTWQCEHWLSPLHIRIFYLLTLPKAYFLSWPHLIWSKSIPMLRRPSLRLIYWF